MNLISGGQPGAGIIRGTGCEQIFNNANPALNREYFDEAHDLMIKAWTVPGPFRFEGKHFNYRFVNRGCCRCKSPTRRFGCPASSVPKR